MFEKIKSCDLCGTEDSSNIKVIAVGKFDHYGVKSDIHTIMCRYCKYIFQHEKFDHEILSLLYERDSAPVSLDIPSKSGLHLDHIKKRQEFISKAINLASLADKKELNILDVGGGAGEVTEHLVRHGRVHLADVNTRDPVNPEIIKVNKLFDEAEFSVKFDVIVMNHVLEHVFSPTEFLKRANNLVTDQGIVIVEVPFELYTPLLGRTGDWKHVAYFSTHVLLKYLKKTGFDPIYLKLCTGYYDTRKLAVIRAVARKTTRPTAPVDFKSGYLQLLFDVINIRALSLYLSTQFRKLVL